MQRLNRMQLLDNCIISVGWGEECTNQNQWKKQYSGLHIARYKMIMDMSPAKVQQ
jgi:hypothetical protein